MKTLHFYAWSYRCTTHIFRHKNAASKFYSYPVLTVKLLTFRDLNLAHFPSQYNTWEPWEMLRCSVRVFFVAGIPNRISKINHTSQNKLYGEFSPSKAA